MNINQLYLGLIVTFSLLFIAIKALFPRKINYFLVGESRSPDPVRDDRQVDIESLSELSDQLVIADSELNILYLSNQLRSQLSDNDRELTSLDDLISDGVSRPAFESSEPDSIETPDKPLPLDTTNGDGSIQLTILSDPHGKNLVCGLIQNHLS